MARKRKKKSADPENFRSYFRNCFRMEIVGESRPNKEKHQISFPLIMVLKFFNFNRQRFNEHTGFGFVGIAV
ncbi:CLUMA_CG018421, isoform A [Clunio marinus]|uniref:CLUMA_CG018421, isoform A n=1 Tax=Clunio marinus TaxID=568069 RepID=A0A1J1IXU6_9DIPT|nr:CLUMA_CG018421, isoform A [Clunio marinus]